jgi:hypothetical protein
MRRQSQTPIDTLIGLADFPHTRHEGWRWAKTCGDTPKFSRERLVCYGTRLRALGMPDHEIVGLFTDLYWDSLAECRANGVFQKG